MLNRTWPAVTWLNAFTAFTPAVKRLNPFTAFTIPITLVILPALLLPLVAEAQIPTQSIRGEVTDAATGSPIPGVTVMVLDQEPILGTTTDPEGNFTLEGVPVGRHQLRFSYIGYEPHIIRDLLITSARETVLHIALRETVTELDELVVQPNLPKDEAINRMAIASTRILSMEEASRYAGGFDDPARLATSFPGVAGNLADNAIVIRGNAPKGLLWRMEGVEIPAPSHFGDIITMGGGGITALSSRMIADSDFSTGAFPAEYGNALSGVFDLNIRNGNNRQYEHTAEIGTIGLDVASEGPIPGLGGSDAASYLFNYRYSTFSLIGPLLPEDAEAIRYQNLSYKINVPTATGSLSLWGIGGSDRSGQSAEENPGNWVYNQDREDLSSPTRFGAAGIRHRSRLSTWISLGTTLSASGSGLRYDLDRYTDDASTLYPRERIESETGRVTLKSEMDLKVAPRHSNRTGFIANRLGYNQQIRFTDDPLSPPVTITDESDHAFLYQVYSQSQIYNRFLTVTGGLHLQHFSLTNSTSVEPRLGARLDVGEHRFSLAYGRHSQAEPLSIYFAHPENRRLELTKADHLVAGYSRMLTSELNLTVEAYHQWLSDVPVVAGSSYSLINLELDWLLNESLTGRGSGRNYGVDLVLERYFSGGWYALFSGSLFDSTYRGGDGIWRDTRFNRGFISSLLGGKEWEFRLSRYVRMLSVSGRLNLMGGKRYSPVDEEASLNRQEIIYDESRAFTQQEPVVLYADLSIQFRTIRSRTTSVWSLQLMNLTGHQEFYGHRINLRDQRIERELEMILVPNISYQIGF